MHSEQQLREEICRIGKLIHQCGMVAATDGNISVRLDNDRVLATATAMSKGMMEPQDLVIVGMDGRKIAGERNVSSEIAMHLLIYSLRPDVGAVVHAHPPTATGFAAAGRPLNEALVSEIVLSLGSVPLAKYGTPGTPELSQALAPLIPHFDAILMANHGVVAYAEDVLRAYMKMETVEHFAKITLVAHQLGSPELLTRQQVEKLVEMRRKYEGVTSRTAVDTTHVVTAEDAATPEASPLAPSRPVAARK